MGRLGEKIVVFLPTAFPSTKKNYKQFDVCMSIFTHSKEHNRMVGQHCWVLVSTYLQHWGYRYMVLQNQPFTWELGIKTLVFVLSWQAFCHLLILTLLTLAECLENWGERSVLGQSILGKNHFPPGKERLVKICLHGPTPFTCNGQISILDSMTGKRSIEHLSILK